MPIFYYHLTNPIAKDLEEVNGSRGFMFNSRGEMELKIQRQLVELGHDIWPSFHTVFGSMGASINYIIPLDIENPFDAHTIKVCKNGAPWSFVKMKNGPNWQQVIGYTSMPCTNPMALTNIEMAQKGITSATYVPRMMQ